MNDIDKYIWTNKLLSYFLHDLMFVKSFLVFKEPFKIQLEEFSWEAERLLMFDAFFRKYTHFFWRQKDVSEIFHDWEINTIQAWSIA